MSIRRRLGGGHSRTGEPVTAEYAMAYASQAYQTMNPGLVDELEAALGGLDGKRAIDVGAGPGHYAAELAERGAIVTWYDLSHEYMGLATKHAKERGVRLTFRIGDIDELTGSYDLVFLSYSWMYCSDDREFARRALDAVAPGGMLFVVMTGESWFLDQLRGRPAPARVAHKAMFHLNDLAGLKIGPAHSSAGTIASALLRAGATDVRLSRQGDSIKISARPRA